MFRISCSVLWHDFFLCKGVRGWAHVVTLLTREEAKFCDTWQCNRKSDIAHCFSPCFVTCKRYQKTILTLCKCTLIQMSRVLLALAPYALTITPACCFTGCPGILHIHDFFLTSSLAISPILPRVFSFLNRKGNTSVSKNWPLTPIIKVIASFELRTTCNDYVSD